MISIPTRPCSGVDARRTSGPEEKAIETRVKVVLVASAVLLPEIDWNWWKLLILAVLVFGSFLLVVPAGRRDFLRYVRKMVSTE